MRGPGSSRVRLKSDSRYHVVPTSTGPRRDPPYRNFVLRGEPQAHGDSNDPHPNGKRLVAERGLERREGLGTEGDDPVLGRAALEEVLAAERTDRRSEVDRDPVAVGRAEASAARGEKANGEDRSHSLRAHGWSIRPEAVSRLPEQRNPISSVP